MAWRCAAFFKLDVSAIEKLAGRLGTPRTGGGFGNRGDMQAVILAGGLGTRFGPDQGSAQADGARSRKNLIWSASCSFFAFKGYGISYC